LSALKPANLAALSATRVATMSGTNLPDGSSTGAWLIEGPSSALDWRNEYVYWVRAIDSDNLQSDSDLVDVQPLKVSASAPAGLSATWNATRCAVDLSWQRTDPDTAGFLLERELEQASAGVTNGRQLPSGVTAVSVSGLALDNYVQLSGITAATTTAYSDSSVFPDNSYAYRVRTIDQAGNQSAPAVLAAAVVVPDGCGNTAIHQVQTTSSAGTATAPASEASSPLTPSRQSVAVPKPADEITLPSSTSGSDDGTATPVVSPKAPAVPKPADEIDIPSKRPD
jgi:hypothetical protein